ncbi:MAG: hypothetical protein PVI75_00035 [Gammaproteobacteria bacterium]
MSMSGLIGSAINGRDAFEMAKVKNEKKESKLKSKITAFFKEKTKDKSLEVLQKSIQEWMKNAKSSLSLGHKIYFQTLCAIYKMLNETSYNKYVKEDDISVDLNEKQQLDSSSYFNAKVNKFLSNGFLYCFGKCFGKCLSDLSRGVRYNQVTYELLMTWQKIIKTADELKYTTDDLENLEIKGEEFMQSSGEQQKLTLG